MNDILNVYVEQNPKKALDCFNKIIVLSPDEKSLLAMRGLCKFQLGDVTGPLHNWKRKKPWMKNIIQFRILVTWLKVLATSMGMLKWLKLQRSFNLLLTINSTQNHPSADGWLQT
ncbi:MAG: hypothetical protein ABFS16_16995 [Bacteroidota bacterium]